MAALRIEDILSWEALLGTIQLQKDGIPDVLPPEFRSITSETEGDAGIYTAFYGQRKTAKVTKYNSPAVTRELKSIGELPVKLLHSHEKITIDPKTYRKLRNYDDMMLQERGVKELGRQMNQFSRLFKNLETSAIMSMLANGKIWVDSSGNLLPSSSSAELTIDYRVPSGNTAQLNVDGGGDIIGASWATASTDISLHIRKIKEASLKLSGYEPTMVFYGRNIPSYLSQNNYLKDWWIRHPSQNEYWMETGEIPDGMFGIKKWVPVYKGFYEDNDGTNQSFFGADTITFTPDITEEVYEFMKGSFYVPSTFQPVGTMKAALDSLKAVYGDFAYAMVTNDPIGIDTHMGTTFLPIWKVPNAIFIADVTP